MAHIERVPITRLVVISGYVETWELDNLIHEIDQSVADQWSTDGDGKIKITIEYTEA